MTDPRIRAANPSPVASGPPPPAAPPPPSEGARQVEYKLTLEDAAAFYRYDTKLSPRVQRKARIPPWVGLIFVGLTVSVGAVVHVMLSGPFPSGIWFPFGIFEGVILVLLVWYLFIYFFGDRLSLRLFLRGMRRNPRVFEKKTMKVSPEGLHLSSSSGESITRWHAVAWVIEHGAHAFFYLTEKQALIVPRRAFADERQFEDFVDTARGYHEAARRLVRPEGLA
jgi:hypothetical protein